MTCRHCGRRSATTVVLAIGAWVLGALLGSQIQRPERAVSPATAATTPVRFAPGRYLFEEPELGWMWAVRFENPWYVRALPPAPVEPTP